MHISNKQQQLRDYHHHHLLQDNRSYRRTQTTHNHLPTFKFLVLV